jgi:UV DNA damage endonuclease
MRCIVPSKAFSKGGAMNIGYACLTLGVQEMDYKTVRMAHAEAAVLEEVTLHNLSSLERQIEYNGKNGIHLFRISSDLIPFGSSPVNELCWWELFSEKLKLIGEKIRKYDIRVSMHPGQYTVLNSGDYGVVSRAIADLVYHARVLDALGTDSSAKIILHIGGVYGDKPAAMDRFINVFRTLPEEVKKRVVVENDERSFNIEEVLTIGEELSIPVVFDNLHHLINPPLSQKNDSEWISIAGKTWKTVDGKQKIHYSQQDIDKQKGSHSFTIAIDPFLDYVAKIGDVDVMLEVKDKNWSAIKCLNCLKTNPSMKSLEEEWARYKYLILEKDPQGYEQVRTLLKDKTTAPAIEFYHLIEKGIASVTTLGHAVNALQHVAGYFKKIAPSEEQKQLDTKINKAQNKAVSVDSVKRLLWAFSNRYQMQYLLESYYFFVDLKK